MTYVDILKRNLNPGNFWPNGKTFLQAFGSLRDFPILIKTISA